jgi:hypothetical protein
MIIKSVHQFTDVIVALEALLQFINAFELFFRNIDLII